MPSNFVIGHWLTIWAHGPSLSSGAEVWFGQTSTGRDWRDKYIPVFKRISVSVIISVVTNAVISKCTLFVGMNLKVYTSFQPSKRHVVWMLLLNPPVTQVAQKPLNETVLLIKTYFTRSQSRCCTIHKSLRIMLRRTLNRRMWSCKVVAAS